MASWTEVQFIVRLTSEVILKQAPLGLLQELVAYYGPRRGLAAGADETTSPLQALIG